jgi:hypothetical protein
MVRCTQRQAVHNCAERLVQLSLRANGLPGAKALRVVSYWPITEK